MTDQLIGVTLPVRAEHAGHTVTVEKRDEVEKHDAYWLVCSCGKRTTIGTHWLKRAVDQGSLAHGAVV
jgi:hypothetical protein